MDAGPVERIVKGLTRLDVVVEAKGDYVQAIRAAGAVSSWSPFWERHFEYELGPVEGGFKPTTSRAACLEN